MAISAARMDRLISETRKNDPRISIDDNFRNFLSFLAEPFYDVDSRSCRVKKGVRSYGFRTTLIRNGMVRMLAFETDAMTLRYSIKKNPYHSFVKFLMVTEGSLSVTVNGVRTLKPEVNQVLIVDPTDDITYATARGTKGVSILLASNYFHARSSHLAALFKELLISGKTPRESCFIGARESCAGISPRWRQTKPRTTATASARSSARCFRNASRIRRRRSRLTRISFAPARWTRCSSISVTRQ